MDKMTKVLLAIISIGILMNALNPWLKPMKVKASALQCDDNTHKLLGSIDSKLGIISSDTADIAFQVNNIANGISALIELK